MIRIQYNHEDLIRFKAPFKTPFVNMLKYLVISLLSMCFIVSCDFREEVFDFPYAGDKLVLNGVLSPQGVSIDLRRSQDLKNYVYQYSPNSFKSNSDTVANAEIWLLNEQGESLSRIPYRSQGKYSLDTILTAGSSYRIRADHPGFPGVMTDAVEIPKPVDHIKARLSERTDLIYRFSIYLQDPSPNDDYFLFSALAWRRNVPTRFWLDISADDSYARQCRMQFYYDFVAGDVCFRNGIFEFDLINEHLGIRYDSIRIEAGTVSPLFFKYVSELNQPSSDLDDFFFQPNLLSSNVRGGYGIVYGRNLKVVYHK